MFSFYVIISFICLTGFTLIHYFPKYLQFETKIPRSKFLSIAAGVSVSYVFIDLLPKLNEYQQVILNNLQSSARKQIENHIYIVSF